MKIQKIIRAQGQWAKKREDIKDGDLIKILDAGQITTGDYGDSHVFKIETRNGERNLRFNLTSLNNCVDAFGEETSGWVGKEVKVWIIKAMVSGKLQDVCYVASPTAVMADDGSFHKGVDDIPVVESEEPVDLPF